MPFSAPWMELVILILSEVKSDRERQIPPDITYIWNPIYGTNEPIYGKETNSWTWRIDLWLPSGRGKDWDGLEFWDSRCNLLHLE